MTISATDIKLRQSQRLTDNPDGGGRMVATEIVDGAMNNLFPDIGDEERTTGRATLRKCFVHVDTPGDDVLKDALGLLVEPPADPNVTVIMTADGSYANTRAEARSRIEGYTRAGTESRYVLMGDHFAGQQAFSVYCMADAPTPDINDTFCLRVESGSSTGQEQFVRVRSILSRSSQSFWDDQGAFERDVLIMETTTALLYDFPGQEVNRKTSMKPPTRVRLTNNAESTYFYGVRRLTDAAAPGDLVVRVGSPYGQLVPATTAETPVSDVQALQGTTSYAQAGAPNSLGTSGSATFAAGVAVARFLGGPVLPGSVAVTVGSVSLLDNGNGTLSAAGASPWSGSIDYTAGEVQVVNDAGGGTQTLAITATPAAAISNQAFTDHRKITAGTQGFNHLFQLMPLPAAGTVYVEYKALGKWIRLADNGAGQLVGQAGQGSGTVNYATGSVLLTAGALPDLGSSIICGWGTGVVAEQRTGDVDIKPPALNFLLPDAGIKPGSFSATLTVGSSPVAVTDNGAAGLVISGTVRGRITYATGEVWLRPETLPDAGTGIALAYEVGSTGSVDHLPSVDGSGIASITVDGAPLRAGSVQLRWLTSVQPLSEAYGGSSIAVPMEARDDGAGNIVGVRAGTRDFTDVLGTINYTTGAMSVKLGKHNISNFPIPTYSIDAERVMRLNTRTRAVVSTNFSAGTFVTVAAQSVSSPVQAETASIALPPVLLELAPTVLDPIIPGSVRFTFRGLTYVDRAGGIYHSIDPATGSGTYAGSIDYRSGTVQLTAWQAGGANTVTINALASTVFDVGGSAAFFRAPGAPLRAGAFTLRATALDGTALTGTADVNGVLTGTGIEGLVDWESGEASVSFGLWVTAAGNEGEPWYDPAAVQPDGSIFRPLLVDPGSIYLGTVVLRNVPLSSVVIGLDSVRLPADGRVPIYRPGQTVLVHHTATHSIASPTAGQVVDFGRTRIAQVEVRDSAGAPVDSAWFTTDMDGGTLQFADPLNLAAYQLPILIRERVEDRRLVVQPQITGEIELNSQLSHTYPAGEAMLSTGLRLGEANGSLDLQARVEHLFDQATWGNVWADAPIGSSAPATYNDTDYPLVITNADAITERWAVRFTTGSAYELIGETVGVIATGTTASDLAPLNPRTGQPYFRMRAGGWGSGWAVNNVVRFNTIGGLAPVWMIRTTMPGTAATATDSTRLQVIGNIAGVTP